MRNCDLKEMLNSCCGATVKACARINLFTVIREFGSDYIYSDTDSVKVLNVENHVFLEGGKLCETNSIH